VLTREAAGAVAVPTMAVRHEGEARTAYVYVVHAGKIARRLVSIGIVDDDQSLTEIRSGVGAGDTVVVGPIEGLVDGAAVQVAAAAAPPAAPAR
jgi:hypothetical protein